MQVANQVRFLKKYFFPPHWRQVNNKFAEVLKNLNLDKALVVLNENDEKVVMSAKNIPTVKTTQINTINVYDVLKYNTVVLTKAAAESIEEVYA